MTPIEQTKAFIESGSLDGLKNLAAQMGNEALVQARDSKFQRQALHFAAKSNRPDIIAWLASIGASLEAEDIDGSRPMHVAAMNGSKEAVDSLLRLGAAPDPARRDGKTPFIFAQSLIGRGGAYPNIAAVLRGFGANAGAVDAEGKSAFDHAQEINATATKARVAQSTTLDDRGLGDPNSLLGTMSVLQNDLSNQAAVMGTGIPSGTPTGSAMDDPLATPTPGPKTATSVEPGATANMAMPRDEAIKKLKDLGFEMLGAQDGAPALTGRAKEVEEISNLLDKRKNVLLTGKAGTGKRSLARAAAESLAAKGKIVMSVPSSSFRGNKYAGSVNENIQKWLGPALSLGDELVLFINDAHQLSTGKTSSDTTDTPIQILREQMDPRKDKRLTLLCATTPKEAPMLDEDAAFVSQFSKKSVTPMSAAETLDAMTSAAGARELLRDHPESKPESIGALCSQAVDLCDKYLFNQSFPAKAFEFASRALAQGAPETWSEEKIGELFCKTYSVPREIVEGRMKADSPYFRLESELKQSLIGQDGPIAEISKAVKSQIVLANPSSHKPVSMLFAGPTGVGKTEASESMARILGLPILVLNMGEYTSPAKAGDLKDQIAEFATKNYAGVILVDEIEKSHPVVRDVLLNLFDKGTVGSGDDKVDCGFMITIATTNVGAREAVMLKRELREQYGDPKIHDSWTRAKMIDEGFRPEFVNRIGLACDFNDITPKDALKIAMNMFAATAKGLLKTRGIELHVDESLAKDHAADVFDADYGARGIKRCVETTMQTIVAESSISLAIGPGSRLEARSESKTIVAKVTSREGQEAHASIASSDANEDLARLQAVLGGFSNNVGRAAQIAHDGPQSAQAHRPKA